MKSRAFASFFGGCLVVNRALVLLCLAPELPGEAEVSRGLQAVGCHQTSLYLGMVGGGDSACKAQMAGCVCLDCVKPLAFCSASGFPVV